VPAVNTAATMTVAAINFVRMRETSVAPRASSTNRVRHNTRQIDSGPDQGRCFCD